MKKNEYMYFYRIFTTTNKSLLKVYLPLIPHCCFYIWIQDMSIFCCFRITLALIFKTMFSFWDYFIFIIFFSFHFLWQRFYIPLLSLFQIYGPLFIFCHWIHICMFKCMCLFVWMMYVCAYIFLNLISIFCICISHSLYIVLFMYVFMSDHLELDS